MRGAATSSFSKDEVRARDVDSDSSEQYKDQYNNDDEAEAAATIITGAIEWAAADAAKATKQCNNQNNENDSSDGHAVLLQPFLLI